MGHAWLNVFAMKAMLLGFSGVGRGMGMGMSGLVVADVGSGGNERIEPVRPGIRRATTFRIERGFYLCDY